MPSAEQVNNKDSYLDMLLRRAINSYVDQPVEFYAEGYKKVLEHTALAPHDVLLDVGCSSGQFVVTYAAEAGITNQLVGVDPLIEPYRIYASPAVRQARFNFVQGFSERLPLKDNSMAVTTAHNMLFRTHNVARSLYEFKRVTKPGGLILISTNARDHALWRHLFERKVAVAVSLLTHQWINPLRPPADGVYLEDMPALIRQSGGLELIDTVEQPLMHTKITRGERFDDFITSLEYSANYTELSTEYYQTWRHVVRELIAPFVLHRIDENQSRSDQRSKEIEPYFADSVHRGMLVLRNAKPVGQDPV